MATEYLDAGAKTFAASAWSGSGLAAANDFIVDVSFGPITAGLDQSAIVGGIESLYFKPGSNGIVGGGSNGSLLIDADNSADAYIANYGQVTLYLAAGGDSTTINEFSCGPGSTNYLTNGTFGNITVDGGFLSLNESVSVTGNIYINSGIVSIKYNAQDATLIEVQGGAVTLERAPTTLRVNGGVVTFDPDENEGYTSKVLEVKGGRFHWRDGAYPTVRLDAGVVDLRKNNRAFTPGATEGFTSSACTIHRHPDVSLTNIITRGASKVDVGGASQLD